MRFITRSASSFSLLAALAILSQTAWTTSNNLECLHTRHSELANRASCGDRGSIAYCLSELPTGFHDTDLKTCFVHAGCQPEEAQIEALWTLARCSVPVAGDLRKRQPLYRRDDATTTAAAATQTDGGHATIVSNGVTSTVACMATSTVSTTSCPKQSTGTAAGKTLSCFPTTVLTTKCASGMLCDKDGNGASVCMRKDDSFHAAGVVISLFFAVALTATLGAILYKCCRERSTQKRLVAAAEAAQIARDAKNAAANKKRPSVAARSVSEQSADSQPLIYPPPSGAPQVYIQPHEDEYEGVQEYDAHGNPFGDHHRMG